MIARAVKLFQACARVSQAKAFTDRGPDETLAIVLDEHGQLSVSARRNNFDAAALGPRAIPWRMAFSTKGCRRKLGARASRTSSAIAKRTVRRSPKR